AAIVLDLVIGIADHLTGYQISFSVFYVIPIALVSWCTGKAEGVAISLLCAATWLLADLSGDRSYSHPLIPYWNALMRLGFFLMVSLSLLKIRWSMESLQEMSRIDPLTGTVNARGFHERAQREIERSVRYGHSFTVAYLDLDNFKDVNDSLGHSTGNNLLVRVAELISNAIRKTDVLARLGGDEFVILFSETGSEAAQGMMARIKVGISQEMHIQGWPVTLSVGLVTFAAPPGSVDEMIQKADDRMYDAKNSGKNIVKFGIYPQEDQCLAQGASGVDSLACVAIDRRSLKS
ncbi:GGDEF domain-containing protein, partial [Thermodesulfobacteriota bacterium]